MQVGGGAEGENFQADSMDSDPQLIPRTHEIVTWAKTGSQTLTEWATQGDALIYVLVRELLINSASLRSPTTDFYRIYPVKNLWRV